MTKSIFALVLAMSSLVGGAALVDACSDSDTTDASVAPPATDASIADAGTVDAAPVIVASGCRSDDDCPTFAAALCSITTTGNTAGRNVRARSEREGREHAVRCGLRKYQNCGYRISDGCSAVLEYCFDLPYKVGGSAIVSIACGCDGG